jgi:O-antigen/teichoic acid export membrane protein
MLSKAKKYESKLLRLKDRAVGNIKRSGGEFFWITLGQVVAVIAGLVGVRLLTGLMSPETYGELALGMTIATLFQQVSFGPFGQATLRFYPPARESNSVLDLERDALHIGKYLVAVTLLGASILVAGLFVVGYTKWAALFTIAFVFAAFKGVNSTINGIQNAARYRIVVAWHKGAFEWLRFLIAAGLVWLFAAKSWVALIGYVIAAVVICISQFVLYWWKIRRPAVQRERAKGVQSDTGQVNRKATLDGETNEGRSDAVDDEDQGWKRRLWDYGSPFAIWGIFTWVHVASDRWALQAFAGQEAVGLYAVLYQLGFYPLTFLSSIVSKFVSPILYERAGDASSKKRVRSAYRLNYWVSGGMILATVSATGAAYLLHPLVFRIFVGEAYRSASGLLPLMALAGGLYATSQVVGLLLMSRAESKRLITPKVATALIGGGLNVVGSYWYGVKGVVIALIIFGVLNIMWTVSVSKIEVVHG